MTLLSYCPGGPDSDFEYSTQSYTGYEVINPICIYYCTWICTFIKVHNI